MSAFTYENSEIGTKLETYEWDNTWLEQANRSDARRVLYIGDSISCGVRKIATERAGGEYLFDGFGSSKGLDHPWLCEALRLFAMQENRRDAVLFNNGLHGWHLNDGEEYGLHYERVLRFLMKEFEGTPLFLVLTTSVANGEREERVKKRNNVARELAQKYGLAVIDLYSVSEACSEFRTDGVHFSREGYVQFADRILAELSKR